MSVYEDNIVPLKISQLAEYVAKVKRIALDDALVYIYINPLYKELYNEGSKWWYLSTEALYREFETWRTRSKKEVSHEVFEFYTYCLENYARSKRISGIDAWALFKESGADDYIVDNYDLLHTQGTEYVLDEIQRFIQKRKK